MPLLMAAGIACVLVRGERARHWGWFALGIGLGLARFFFGEHTRQLRRDRLGLVRGCAFELTGRSVRLERDPVRRGAWVCVAIWKH